MSDASPHGAPRRRPESIAFTETDTSFQIAWPGAIASTDQRPSTPIAIAAAS